MEKPMAPDDRDRTFDKALSRHLRATGSLSPGSALRNSACLDPEMLAAYHERSLLPEEMNSAKEHIVGCAHCQAILAQLEATDSISLVPVEKEEVRVLAATQEKARSLIPIRGPRWRWLVPAGALAAGLLVWISLHENPRPPLTSQGEVKMAKAQEPPAPLPSLEKQAPAAPSTAQLDTLSKSRGAVGGAVMGRVSRDADSLKQLQKSASGAGGARSVPVQGKELESRKDAVADSSAALVETEKQETLDAKAAIAGAAREENVPLQNQAANIQTQNQMISPSVHGPTPPSQAQPSKKAKSDANAYDYLAAPAPAPAAPAPVSAFNESHAMRLAAIPNPHLIAAHGTKTFWLAGRAGKIEFSSDGGASWSRQTSGVLVDLLTGSAPTDKICWIVGRAGTILLTTDSGAHWAVLPSPLDEDLGGVRAIDALHATIWNLQKTKSFETSDGGVTWKLVSAPQ
jgi:hypothetical protein